MKENETYVDQQGRFRLRPLAHLSAGTLLAAGNYILNRKTDISAGCLLGAVICDTDHIVEYAEYCHDHHVKPDFNEWRSGEYFTKKGSVKVVFHSWELCFLSWLIIWLLRDRRDSRALDFFRGLTAGYTSHLIMDQIGNGAGGKSYFLLYRWIKGWKQKNLFS